MATITTYCYSCKIELNRTAYYKHVKSERHIKNEAIITQRVKQNQKSIRNPIENDIPIPLPLTKHFKKLNKNRIKDLERKFKKLSLKRLLRELNAIKNVRTRIINYENLVKNVVQDKIESDLNLEDLFKVKDISISERHGPATDEIRFHYDAKTVDEFFDAISHDIRNRVRKHFEKGIKITSRLHCNFLNVKTDEEIDRWDGANETLIILDLNSIDTLSNQIRERFKYIIENLTNVDPNVSSSLVLIGVNELIINIAEYIPQSGGSYMEIPKYLKNSNLFN